MTQTTKTPCIGVCSTGIGDQICRGCKRYSHEIVNWNSYSDEQRRVISRRLESLLAQVVSDKLDIVDETQLKAALLHQQIAFDADLNPYCWLLNLLKAGASQISNLSVYGIRYRAKWRQHTLREIREAIESDYYTLSCAHYDRYFTSSVSGHTP